MKYIFSTTLTNIPAENLFEQDGALEVAATHQVQTVIDLNTELPEIKVEELRASLEQFYTEKFGEVSTKLTSKQ